MKSEQAVNEELNKILEEMNIIEKMLNEKPLSEANAEDYAGARKKLILSIKANLLMDMLEINNPSFKAYAKAGEETFYQGLRKFEK
jgi:hypothetical protein